MEQPFNRAAAPTVDQAAAELDRYAAELADQARAAYGAGLVLR